MVAGSLRLSCLRLRLGTAITLLEATGVIQRRSAIADVLKALLLDLVGLIIVLEAMLLNNLQILPHTHQVVLLLTALQLAVTLATAIPVLRVLLRLGLPEVPGTEIILRVMVQSLALAILGDLDSSRTIDPALMSGVLESCGSSVACRFLYVFMLVYIPPRLSLLRDTLPGSTI